MKKILFLIPLVVALITISRTPAYAYTDYFNQYSYIAIVQGKGVHNLWHDEGWYIVCDDAGYPMPIDSANMRFNSSYRHYEVYPSNQTYIFWGFPSPAQAMLYLNSGEYYTEVGGEPVTFSGYHREYIDGNTQFNAIIGIKGTDYTASENVYPTYQDWFNHVVEEPEEDVDNWFKRIWNFIMDQLAITDDFSEDLYDWIFEGDDGDGGHSGGSSFEYVTPTPSPTPTPAPTPTPYTLDIVDNNGNPVYTITGIPNQTITINNTTNNENGDDFDIFEVDVKLLPSGGVSNPKDGLNSVMESNLEVLEDIDITPVGASFSVLPSDWFIMLGAIICMPFIAGFISKLLK